MTKYIDKLLKAQKANNQEIFVNDGTVRSVDKLQFQEMFGVEYIRRSVFTDLPDLIQRRNKIFIDIINEDTDHFSRFSHRQMKDRIISIFKKEKKFWKFFLSTERRFLYGDEITHGNTAPIIICSISDVFQNECYDAAGFGLFAGKDIVKGQFIGEAAGNIRRVNLKEKVDLSYAYPCSNEDGGSIEVNDSSEMGNALRFLNHSVENNNVEILQVCLDDRNVLFAIAINDIKKGSQLLLDYGVEYWTKKVVEPIKF